MVSSRPENLEALRAATRDVHEALERELAIARPDAGKREYHRWARAMWGWLAPFESALWAASWPASIDGAARDGKRVWLQDDLRALGDDNATIAALPQAPVTPPIATPSERFGVAYVLEGSTLGGQVLHRRLAPAIAPCEGRYLLGNGARTGPLWKGFVEALGREELSPDERDASANAARATFVELGSWLREQVG